MRKLSQRPSMDLHIKKVWLPGAASCLLLFGSYYVLIWLPFETNRLQFLAIPYLVLPFAGALAAYWSRRMKGSVLERILSALYSNAPPHPRNCSPFSRWRTRDDGSWWICRSARRIARVRR